MTLASSPQFSRVSPIVDPFKKSVYRLRSGFRSFFSWQKMSSLLARWISWVRDLSLVDAGKLRICNALPKTNTSPLKMDGWKMKFSIGKANFQGYVSFREGTWAWSRLESLEASAWSVQVPIYPFLNRRLIYYLWTTKPWNMKVLGPKNMGSNLYKWRL